MVPPTMPIFTIGRKRAAAGLILTKLHYSQIGRGVNQDEESLLDSLVSGPSLVELVLVGIGHGRVSRKCWLFCWSWVNVSVGKFSCPAPLLGRDTPTSYPDTILHATHQRQHPGSLSTVSRCRRRCLDWKFSKSNLETKSVGDRTPSSILDDPAGIFAELSTHSLRSTQKRAWSTTRLRWGGDGFVRATEYRDPKPEAEREKTREMSRTGSCAAGQRDMCLTRV